jgi:hypothetical protein
LSLNSPGVEDERKDQPEARQGESPLEGARALTSAEIDAVAQDAQHRPGNSTPALEDAAIVDAVGVDPRGRGLSYGHREAAM